MQKESTGKLSIKGYSDDNLEFRGSIYDEVGCWDAQPEVELPDGSKIKFWYDGIWNAELVERGSYPAIKIIPGEIAGDINAELVVDQEVPYAIVRVDDKIHVVGNIPLDEKQSVVFSQLEEAFYDDEEFEARKNIIRAILTGVKIY
jgi:hypothetical protein